MRLMQMCPREPATPHTDGIHVALWLSVHCCKVTQTILSDAAFPMPISQLNKALLYRCSECGEKDGLMMGPYHMTDAETG